MIGCFGNAAALTTLASILFADMPDHLDPGRYDDLVIFQLYLGVRLGFVEQTILIWRYLLTAGGR
jgi:hypothetical protein